MKLRLMDSDKVCDGEVVERRRAALIDIKKRLKVQAFYSLT
ncbi:hypothetical protein [Pseudoalteromonas piscicida]|nr:hypothetical protein [Pseudoalteromonas piscicida]